MRTEILSFSSRRNGNCDAIAAYIASLTRGAVHCFSAMHPNPCGHCAYECFHSADDCPHIHDGVRLLYETVLRADMVYYLVPNYCDFPCANFFIFQERGQCCFQGAGEKERAYLAVPKRFIVVSNTGEEHFRAAFREHVQGAPDVLFLAAGAYGRVSIDGDLLRSDAAREAVRAFVQRSGPQETAGECQAPTNRPF